MDAAFGSHPFVRGFGSWTVRRIIIDTLNGASPHGGRVFSGKIPARVDRSATYAARDVAKNPFAAGLARRSTIQLV